MVNLSVKWSGKIWKIFLIISGKIFIKNTKKIIIIDKNIKPLLEILKGNNKLVVINIEAIAFLEFVKIIITVVEKVINIAKILSSLMGCFFNEKNIANGNVKASQDPA